MTDSLLCCQCRLIGVGKDVPWKYPSICLRCWRMPSQWKAEYLALSSYWEQMSWLKFCMTFSFRMAPKRLYIYIFQIFDFSNNYWELRRCRPKLKKLKKLLMENTYEGPDSQKEKDSNHSKVRLIFIYFVWNLKNRTIIRGT